MANWKQLIADAAGDDKVLCSTLTEKELLAEFDNGYGEREGKAFTAWGEMYVYFPVLHDGAEWVGRAPRNPCDEVTEHMGGA